MTAMVILFLSLAFGTLIEVPIGGSVYEFEYAEIIVVLLAGIILYKYIRFKKRIHFSTFQMNVGILFLLLFSYGIYSFNWSEYGVTVLPGAMPFFYGFLVAFISNEYYSTNENSFIIGFRWLIAVMFIQLLISMLGLLETDVSGFYAVKDFARTPMGKSNLLSFYFVFGLLYEFIAKEKNWILFFSLNLIALILTLSRGAIFTLVISLAIYLVVALMNTNFNKFQVVVNFGILIALFLIFMFSTAIGQEFLDALSSGLRANTVGTRQVLWRNAFSEFLNNPFGVGIVWMEDPHNFILGSWRNFGLILGSIYILFLSYPMLAFLSVKIRNYSTKTVALLVAYSSVYFHALIEVYFFSTASVIFTVLTVSYIHFQLKEETSKYQLTHSRTIAQEQNSRFFYGGSYE